MKGTVMTKAPSGYFTNPRDVFAGLGNEWKHYKWLISSYECNVYPSKLIPEGSEYAVVEGEQLSEIINNYSIQFIWGVFSGFSYDVSVDDILRHKIPLADGNSDLWNQEVKLQHPLAKIEIIAWDSGLTIVISSDDGLIERFREIYPDSADFEEFRC